MTIEEWKYIPNYEGMYQASSLGRVRSVNRWVRHPRGTMMQRKGVVISPTSLKNGYRMVCLSKDGKLTYYNVHRLVAMAFVPNPESKSQVNHIDGDKSNNKPENLEWLTPTEHGKDRREKGQVSKLKGSECPMAKLNEEIITMIKNRLSTGETGRSVAKALGISEGMVSLIKNNHSWKHVV